MTPSKKRRILRSLKLTEISGVDRPCQEGALVTIMKRADDPLEALQLRMLKLRADIMQAKLSRFG